MVISFPYDNVTKYKSKYIFVIFKTNCNKNATFLRIFNKKPSDILKCQTVIIRYVTEIFSIIP